MRAPIQLSIGALGHVLMSHVAAKHPPYLCLLIVVTQDEHDVLAADLGSVPPRLLLAEISHDDEPIIPAHMVVDAVQQRSIMVLDAGKLLASIGDQLIATKMCIRCEPDHTFLIAKATV